MKTKCTNCHNRLFQAKNNVAITILFFIFCFNITLYAQQIEIAPSGYKWYKVEKKGLLGAKNLSGETIVPTKYTDISYHDTGHFIVTNKKGYSECYDINGRKIIDEKEKYHSILPWETDGIIWFSVYRNGFVGAYASSWGEVIAPNKFTIVNYNTDCNTNLGKYGRKGYFEVRDENGHGIYDAYGNEIIGTSEGYDLITPQGRGLYSRSTWFEVYKDGLYGACLLGGLKIIPAEYKYIYHSIVYGFQALTMKNKEINLGIRMSEDGFEIIPKNTNDDFNVSTTTTKQHSNTGNPSTPSNKCTMCANSNGKCPLCNGSGKAYWLNFYVQCTACYGTGKCPMCHGTRIWIPGTENVPMSTGSSSDNNSSNSINKETKFQENSTSHECSVCHGTGYQQGYTEAPYYGGAKVKKYCSICKRKVYPHAHKPCSRCHGTGRIK